MADADLARAIRNPGRLCLAPTDLSADFPHGGTALGLVRDVRLGWGVSTVAVRAEEWGGEEVGRIWTGGTAVLALVLEQWDEDALARVFPRAVRPPTASPTNGLQGLFRLEGAKTGYGLGVVPAIEKLLFSPLDPRHPAVLFRRPIPDLEVQAQLVLSLQEDAVFPLVFTATRDDSGKAGWQVGELGHLDVS